MYPLHLQGKACFAPCCSTKRIQRKRLKEKMRRFRDSLDKVKRTVVIAKTKGV